MEEDDLPGEEEVFEVFQGVDDEEFKGGGEVSDFRTETGGKRCERDLRGLVRGVG